MKTFLITASIFGALAVVMGAFGAHGLKPLISADSLEVYKTAVLYHFIHVFAMLAAGILYLNNPQKLFRLAGIGFLVGIILFSGSLYLLSTRDATGLHNISFLGPITPIGGLFFIVGWISLALGIGKLRLNG